MLTGKRCVCLGLCVACLFLGGCRAAEEAASDPGAQTDGQAQSVESSEALGADTPDFAGHGMTMSREEYFSRERYVNWCQSLTWRKRVRIWQDGLFPDCAAGFNGGGRSGIQKGRHI